ncbi:MAG: hypothetical protein GEU94_15865 [Micromonosporaceae bacterium]|nr:hypothetical protein [Micromonosporaceae bacterium]
MSVMTAAVVLAWICLILLAFGLAGLLRQVRDLHQDLAELGAQGARPLRGRQVAEFAGAPTAVLVVDPGCSMCTPVVEVFTEVAAAAREARFEVLSYRVSADWPANPQVRQRIDERLYQRLDVPWAPALLVTDDDGVITSATPVESPADLRHQLSAVAGQTPSDKAVPALSDTTRS